MKRTLLCAILVLSVGAAVPAMHAAQQGLSPSEQCARIARYAQDELSATRHRFAIIAAAHGLFQGYHSWATKGIPQEAIKEGLFGTLVFFLPPVALYGICRVLGRCLEDYSHARRLLLGESLDYCDRNNVSKLSCFVESDRLGGVRQMLVHGADPNFRRRGFSPLMRAIHRGNVAMVKILLDHGADVTFGPSDSWTPLSDAIALGSVQMSRLLSERGAVCTVPRLDPHFREQCKRAWKASQQALLARKRCIEKSVEQYNVPTDVAELIMSFSEKPETLFGFKRHKQVCDMLE